jgi:hypothetical protein
VAELKRWIIVVLMGLAVAALAFRSFFAIYLFVPLGLLLAATIVRAVVRFSRGLSNKNAADITESYRSAARGLAWLALCAAVVVGHDAQVKELKGRVESRVLALDQAHQGAVFPETVADFPAGCTYGRNPSGERYFVVCTFTPPFEKGTYTSANKRWD